MQQTDLIDKIVSITLSKVLIHKIKLEISREIQRIV